MKFLFFFLLFYNDLDLNNQKILCLPSIFQFERKLGFWTTLHSRLKQFRKQNTIFARKSLLFFCGKNRSVFEFFSLPFFHTLMHTYILSKTNLKKISDSIWFSKELNKCLYKLQWLENNSWKQMYAHAIISGSCSSTSSNKAQALKNVRRTLQTRAYFIAHFSHMP